MDSRPKAPDFCPEHNRVIDTHTLTKRNGEIEGERKVFACGCSWSAEYLGPPLGWAVDEYVVLEWNDVDRKG